MAVRAARFTGILLGAIQDVAKIVDGAAIGEQPSGLDGGDLDLFIQVAQQECDARASGWVADLLNRDQRFVDHLAIFRAQGFGEIGKGFAAPQDANGASGVGAGIHAGATAGDFSERPHHFGTSLNEGINYLVVGVGEFAFDGRAQAAERSPRPVLAYPGR